jgi:Glycosyltransferase family 87
MLMLTTPSVKTRNFLVTAFLLAMAFCNLTLFCRLLPSLRNGYQDFTIFYTGARLLRDGHASDLYNLSSQYRIQLGFAHVPIRQGPLPFNHPPFEALLFVPLTLLGYWPAYLLWTALNLIMLTASIILLRNYFVQLAAVPSAVLGLAAAAFFPVAIGIIQGQDIVLLELLFVLAVICLDKGYDVAAGAFLAAGLFRPQLVVPLVVLLAIRRWRVLVGFAPVAIILAIISIAIVGWRGPIDYIHFVLHLEATRARGFGQAAVPNLRGLIANLPWISASGAAMLLLLTFASSMLLFFIALRRVRIGRDAAIFTTSLAAVTTVLVSFHALVYDLTLLFPMLLFLLAGTVSKERKTVDPQTMLLLFVCFLAPLYVFLLFETDRFFWFSLIVLWLYFRLISTPSPAQVPA